MRGSIVKCADHDNDDDNGVGNQADAVDCGNDDENGVGGNDVVMLM